MKSDTAKFKQSYYHLSAFLDKWVEKLQERCLPEEQNTACFYIWCRYTMSIHTLHQICDPHYMPDIYVIARSCLEYYASFMAVLKDSKLASAYIEYPDRARAHYCKVLERLGYGSALAKHEPHLKSVFGDDWRSEARISWYPQGSSQLVETYGGLDERRLYASYSHFAHGSALALQTLQNTLPSQSTLDKVVVTVHYSYIEITRSLLELAWGKIVTQDSESCKSEFVEVAAAVI